MILIPNALLLGIWQKYELICENVFSFIYIYTSYSCAFKWEETLQKLIGTESTSHEVE